MTPLTPAEFTDRVMTAMEAAPLPTPTRAFLSAIRARAARDGVAALWVAWHLGTVRNWHIEPRVRARSLALVFAVATVLGTGSLAAAAAVHVVAPPRAESAPTVEPAVSGVDELGPVKKDHPGSDERGLTNDGNSDPNSVDESDETDADHESPDDGNEAGETDGTDADGDLTRTDGDQSDETDVDDERSHDGDEAEETDGTDGDGDLPRTDGDQSDETDADTDADDERSDDGESGG